MNNHCRGCPNPQDAEQLLVGKIDRADAMLFGDFADGIGIDLGINAIPAERLFDFNYPAGTVFLFQKGCV